MARRANPRKAKTHRNYTIVERRRGPLGFNSNGSKLDQERITGTDVQNPFPDNGARATHVSRRKAAIKENGVGTGASILPSLPKSAIPRWTDCRLHPQKSNPWHAGWPLPDLRNHLQPVF